MNLLRFLPVLFFVISCAGFQKNYVSARVNVYNKDSGIYGTAFLLEGHLLTAGHVCMYMATNGVTASITYVGTEGQLHHGGVFFPKRIWEKQDVCELGELEPVKHKMKNLRLRERHAISGEHVWIVGAPHGIYPFTTEGYIVGYNLEGLWSSVPVSGGNSGSPLLDDYGNVLGMLVSGGTRYNHISLSVPAYLLREFLDERN